MDNDEKRMKYMQENGKKKKERKKRNKIKCKRKK